MSLGSGEPHSLLYCCPQRSQVSEMLEELTLDEPRFLRLAIPPQHMVDERKRPATGATRKINSSGCEQLLVGSLRFLRAENLCEA
jgi:hypothetical protein